MKVVEVVKNQPGGGGRLATMAVFERNYFLWRILIRVVRINNLELRIKDELNEGKCMRVKKMILIVTKDVVQTSVVL